MAAFLQLSDISKRFGGVRALEHVDLVLEQGEVHCIAGENGSGKSTLIKIIAGVQAPEPGGRIVIEGQHYPHLTPNQSTTCGIQIIYQDLSLFPNLTVAENIGMAQHLGSPHLVDWSEIERIALGAVERIGANLALDRKVEELPIAQRQIVAICRALAGDAKLVIMDEPTASLTRQEIKTLLQLIADLKARGITIVFVSHKLDEVLEVADKVTVLRDGKCVGTFSATGINDKKLAFLMTGKEFHYDLREVDLSKAPVVLSVSDLERTGDYQDVSFEVRAGEIFGITGLLGSGRTELALSLFGMNPPDRGEIRIGGNRVVLRSNRDAIKQGIAYVSEDRLSLGLILQQPISSNIVVTIFDKISGALGLLDPAKRKTAVRDWIRDLAIKVSNPENSVSTLSGGNQQRVVLAKWLACAPRLLILDSPTVGVDINAKDGIYDIVRKLAATGVAIIMISDEVPEVLYHSHRIGIMRGGRLEREFLAHATTEHEISEAINA
ncbi:sugar ABC transporter ATP-binding protein [Labrys wisconsinensis]|uniref:Simple sugar transport system ATP-binding protein n=1 Tax=Labrys wisconsinensis TaxID=425677 RepID=A0ABU0JE22_9HYPH|nr:sugar ABC transporter ATP-binding protein [Labrys wisconsinensis]MDQ0471377.1 simple sugar transport system ATP-binding protein [Labrys wisconsinensis]